MIFIKNRRYKPIYKKFLALRQNVLNSDKFFLFNRRKWKNLISQLERLQKKYPQEYKLYDHTLYFLPKYSNSFKNNFRYNLRLKQRLKLVYSKLLKRYLKKHISSILTKNNLNKTQKNNSLNVLEFFENRLDVILYRSYFVPSIKIARQLILHKHITINKVLVTNPLKKLKVGDIIEISTKFHKKIAQKIQISEFHFIPPKYLQINYKTFQILIVSKLNKINSSILYSFWFDLPTFAKCFKN
uniref:ribosomal protein S4 n=1 Tax=Odontella aurita TaxID=265563 RepID=UPI0020291FAE|nr:ribosomal protein S4 [Odontella aurita]QYB22948.1 ribosomal protein S4 [Odontella aurita]